LLARQEAIIVRQESANESTMPKGVRLPIFCILLEIIDKAGGPTEFRDFFCTTVLREKCLDGDIAKHLVA
jgi:hypothetical protein